MSQFRRVFAAETGLQPKQYLDKYKMRLAAELLLSQGIVSGAEIKGVNAVLDAAALTYVAAAAQAIMQLVYFLTIMNRRNS